MKNKLRVGIMPLEKYKKRTIAIAAGKYAPRRDEPSVWFPSIESAMQVLSTKNQELLGIILDKEPDSVSSLAQMTGRSKSNLSRTLRTMEHYGLLELVRENRKVVPRARTRSICIDIEIPAGS